MDLAKTDNLLNVFFKQYIKQNSKEIFLNWLKFPEKNYSWEETKVNIIKLAKELKKNLNKGERCLLVSENRPEWLISDIAIMLAGGITVPSYITYTEKDYEFIIDDCEPTIVIVSNQILFNKLKDIIPKKKFIKKNNFILVIADFYYLDSANNLKKQLINQTGNSNFIVKKINNNKYRLYVGPFKNFNTLKSTYISLNNLGFENLNVYKK